MTIYEHIGRRIREVRKLAHFTQNQLAARIGVTEYTISRWETAAYKIAIDDLYLLSMELDVPLSTFLPENNIMEQTPELNAELKAWDAMVETMRQLQATKTDQRTPRDRAVAVTITKLEMLMAYYNLIVMQGRNFTEES